MDDIDEKSRHGVIFTVTVMDCTRKKLSAKRGVKLNSVASKMNSHWLPQSRYHGDHFIGKS